MKNTIFDKIKTNIFIAILAALLIGYLIWIKSFDQIDDIANHIDHYKNKIIFLKGKSVSSFSLPFTGSLYKIQDNSGSIWIVSKIDVVQNSTIYLTGKVETNINMNSELDKQLRQYNLKIENLGPIIIEINRESLWASIENIFKN